MIQRRSFLKGSMLGVTSVIAIPFFGSFTLFTKGCNVTESDVDKVLKGIDVADQIAKNLKPIIDQASPEVGTIVGVISADLELVQKSYKDYETVVDAATKQSALVQIQGGVVAVSNNLAALLEAVHVKNPTLITTVSVAVAVINSAITVLVNTLPAQQTTSARSLSVSSKDKLPIIKDAKSADDFKKIWNTTVEKDHPQAVVQ